MGGVGEIRPDWIDPPNGRATDSTAEGKCMESSLRFIFNPAVGHRSDDLLKTNSNHELVRNRLYEIPLSEVYKSFLFHIRMEYFCGVASVAETVDRLFN